MDEPLPSLTDRLQDAQILHRLMVYETACALAESASLTDAAPRMLRAVCVSLGCEYGAFWEVDCARTSVRWVSSWQHRTAEFEEFVDVSRQTVFRRGQGLPGRVWASGPPAWIPDVQQDDELSARGHRGTRRPARRLRLPDAAPRGTSSASWSSSAATSAARRRPAVDADTVGNQIGLFVDRKRWAQEELDRFFTLSLDLLCVANFDGYFLRVNPGVGARARLHRGGAAGAPFIDFVHPDDRDGDAAEAMASLGAGRARHRLREPLPHRDGIVPLAAVDLDPVAASRASSTPPRATSPIATPAEETLEATPRELERSQRELRSRRRAARAARQGAGYRKASAPRRPREPRASSSPT